MLCFAEPSSANFSIDGGKRGEGELGRNGTAQRSARLTMSSRWGQCVSARSDGQPRVEAGNVATNASKGSSKVAFSGKDEVRSGQHVASFKIVASSGNYGYSMYIGVMDASVSMKAGDCGRVVAWSFNPCTGNLCTFTNPVGWGMAFGKLLGPRLKGKANGATVTVTVDMDARRMKVSVNGAAAVDAGVELPEAVRLWCSLCYPGDAVQLVSVSSSGGAGAAPPSDLKRRLLTAAEVDAMKVSLRRGAASHACVAWVGVIDATGLRGCAAGAQVEDLKRQLEARGLSTSGLKAALAARLKEAGSCAARQAGREGGGPGSSSPPCGAAGGREVNQEDAATARKVRVTSGCWRGVGWVHAQGQGDADRCCT